MYEQELKRKGTESTMRSSNPTAQQNEEVVFSMMRGNDNS